MAKGYKRPGKVLDIVANADTGALVNGQLLHYGNPAPDGAVGVVLGNAALGQSARVNTDGIYLIKKTPGLEIKQGWLVYFDAANTAGIVTKGTNSVIGRCATAAAAADTVVEVNFGQVA